LYRRQRREAINYPLSVAMSREKLTRRLPIGEGW
jgi:hypothetical protein